MMEWRHVLLLVTLMLNSSRGEDPMKLLALGFLKVLDECKVELNNDNLIPDLYHLWKREYESLTRETGCAIICMSKKLDLMNDDGKLHHGNAKEFAMKHGAGDDLATKMVAIIRDCEDQYLGIQEDCERVLEVAKCFRLGIREIKWNPKMDVLITEVLTEI